MEEDLEALDLNDDIKSLKSSRCKQPEGCSSRKVRDWRVSFHMLPITGELLDSWIDDYRDGIETPSSRNKSTGEKTSVKAELEVYSGAALFLDRPVQGTRPQFKQNTRWETGHPKAKPERQPDRQGSEEAKQHTKKPSSAWKKIVDAVTSWDPPTSKHWTN